MGLITTRIKPLFRPIYHHSLGLFITLLRRARGDRQDLTWIDPLSVKHTVNSHDRTLKRNDMWHFGRVCGGDWDLDGVPVQEYGHIYPILRQRVIAGMDFNAIPEFRENLERIRRGESPENCRTEEEYREKWRGTEALYGIIKVEGYKTQRELGALRPLNEIRVQVGRDGRLLFEEGIHRLVITQLLGLKCIPVIVTRQHAEWVAHNGRWHGDICRPCEGSEAASN
ncbi:MAG: hypothetical protein A4E69_02531 [Syntrophus sp. PtaB.Bin138]|nr:MAG: hypothetical protein A4E69_02531 [Syntrophus sp. PtaB.Bin138]